MPKSIDRLRGKASLGRKLLDGNLNQDRGKLVAGKHAQLCGKNVQLPKLGVRHTRPTGAGITPFVDSPQLRTILARNLRRIIESEVPKGGRFSVRAWALSKGLEVRMIDRLLKEQNAITLDKLDEIARSCGLKAWQLIYDDLDPGRPPADPLSPEERSVLERLLSKLGK